MGSARPLDLMDRMRRKLKTKLGKQICSKRKEKVEAVFGQMKQARGIRSFLLKALGKVRAEWELICLTHNVLKLWRHIVGDEWRSVRAYGKCR